MTALNNVEKREGLSNISAVANYFIDCSKKERIPLSNLSIQKLVYFAYGWTLVIKEEKLGDYIEYYACQTLLTFPSIRIQ